MTEHNWKKLARNNIFFDGLLKTIIQKNKINKIKLKSVLTIEAKYELIRMQSLELVEFNESYVKLGKEPYDLISACPKTP